MATYNDRDENFSFTENLFFLSKIYKNEKYWLLRNDVLLRVEGVSSFQALIFSFISKFYSHTCNG